jgi:hypothetical protein
LSYAAPREDERAALGGARRAIPWDALDPAELAPEDRRALGERWKARREQEHLAVGAFAELAFELAAVGGEPVVLGMLTRAAWDEVRHAEICRRAAALFLGEGAVSAQHRGVPQAPPHADVPAEERALFHVVEMCCLSETFTGVYLTETLARTTHPTMRAVVESLLEDEIDHGRVGWAHLAVVRARSNGAALGGLARALPDMLDRTIGRVLRLVASDPEAERSARSARGHLANDACGPLARRTLREVILPGFESLGVDLGPAQAKIRDAGW